MKKVKNNSKDRVVLYALEGGREAPYVVPPFATVLVPDAVFSLPAPPREHTKVFISGIFTTVFQIGEDIDLNAGVTVFLPKGYASPPEYETQDRPGQISFPKPFPRSVRLEVTYTNWANDEYAKRGIISVL